MGLFDHLFKSKSPSSEEASVEAGPESAESAKRSDAAARSLPPERADPSVFLHPKSFVPRGATALTPPGKPGAAPAARKPGATPAPPAADEIVLTLGDVLSRIPSPFLKIGQHDPKRELRFRISDLSSDIARGRAAVPLSRIAELMPDIFVKEIAADEDTEVRLPLQKLVEQIGLLRSRPQGGSSERIARPAPAPPQVETLHPQPDPEIRLEPLAAAAQTLEPDRETLPDLLAPAEPRVELKPAVTAAEGTPVTPEPAPVVSPVGEAPASDATPLRTAPAPTSPEAKTPAEVAPEEPPTGTTPAPDVVKGAAVPPAQDGGGELPSAPKPERSEPLSTPVADLKPAATANGEPPASEVPARISNEPVRPLQLGAPPIAPTETTVPEVIERESEGERIHLSLAAIVRECPPEIIIGVLPEIPDNIRITLPFAPIDRQLVQGRVEISAVRFVAAVPLSYQKYFAPLLGVKVPIPLEEVFQNLPDPNVIALAASAPALQILELRALGDVGRGADMRREEKATAVPTSEANPLAIDRTEPSRTETPNETVPEATGPVSGSSEAPTSATPPLDLPALHLYVPPPPEVHPEEFEIPAAITIGPELPAEVGSGAAKVLAGAVPSTPEHSGEGSQPKGDAEVSAVTGPREQPTETEGPQGGSAPGTAEPASAPPVETTAPLAPTSLPTDSGPSHGEVAAADLIEADQRPASFSPAHSPLGGDRPAPQAVMPETPDSETTAGAIPKMHSPIDSTTTPPDEAPEVAPIVKDEPVAEPPFGGNSAAVFAEANQTIPAPQWVRPVMILPPPIFAYKPEPVSENASSVELQMGGGEGIALTFTDNKETGIGAQPSETAPMGPEIGRPEERAEAQPPSTSPSEAAANDISSAEATAGAVNHVLPFSLAPEQAPTDLAPQVEVAEPSPQSPLHGEGTPGAVGGGERVSGDAVAAGAVSGEFLASEALKPQPPTAISVEFEVVTGEHVPSERVTGDSATGEIATGDVLSGGTMPDDPAAATPEIAVPRLDGTRAEESVPPVLPGEAIAPQAEAIPIETPASAIVFTVEGQFTERPPQAVPVWDPLPKQESRLAEPPPIQESLISDEPTVPELAPLLALPRLISDAASGDAVLPPSLPLRRFDQDALQALFMTDEVLDLARISRLAAQLPGVHACVIATRDQACTGGRLPEGFDLAALLGLAPRVGEAAGRMPIGALKHFTLYGEQYSVSFFERNGLSLCAVHRPRSFVPGVREKLVAIADELSK